jgi:8-oxo-dGTP pyrophosphatase MutT (NUDIX family)
MTNQSDNPWKKLDSKIVYQNRWYSVRCDKVIRPDGKPGEYNVVQALDGAFVIALDETERIQLIRKYRYTTDMYSLEVPAGGIEKGETPLTGAKRELQEELGLTAQEWKEAGKFQAENAYINNFGWIFIARGLKSGTEDDRLAEGINKTERVTIQEAMQLIKSGEITDSQSITALTLAAFALGYMR